MSRPLAKMSRTTTLMTWLLTEMSRSCIVLYLFNLCWRKVCEPRHPECNNTVTLYSSQHHSTVHTSRITVANGNVGRVRRISTMAITKVQRAMYYHSAGQTLGPSNMCFPIYANHMNNGKPGGERLYASGFMCALCIGRST